MSKSRSFSQSLDDKNRRIPLHARIKESSNDHWLIKECSRAREVALRGRPPSPLVLEKGANDIGKDLYSNISPCEHGLHENLIQSP